MISVIMSVKEGGGEGKFKLKLVLHRAGVEQVTGFQGDSPLRLCPHFAE